MFTRRHPSFLTDRTSRTLGDAWSALAAEAPKALASFGSLDVFIRQSVVRRPLARPEYHVFVRYVMRKRAREIDGRSRADERARVRRLHVEELNFRLRSRAIL